MIRGRLPRLGGYLVARLKAYTFALLYFKYFFLDSSTCWLFYKLIYVHSSIYKVALHHTNIGTYPQARAD